MAADVHERAPECGRDDSICYSHSIDSSDLCRGDPGGSRAAWRSAVRGRRHSRWWWRRRGCGPALCSPALCSTSLLRAQLCPPFFLATFLGASHSAAHSCAACITASRSGAAYRAQHAYPIQHSSRAAAIRSTSTPAPITYRCRSNRLRAVAGSSAADSETHKSSC